MRYYFYKKLLNMLLLMIDIKYIRLSTHSGSKCALKSQTFLILEDNNMLNFNGSFSLRM